MRVRSFASVGLSFVALAPLLALEGMWIRWRTPILPEAGPPHVGLVPAPAADASLSAGPVSASLKLILLGESTVAGVGARSHEAGLVGRTAAALAAQTGRAVAWRSVGRNGATAAQCLTDLTPQLAGAPADLLVIVLGVNDTIRLTPPAAWQADLHALIQEARSRTGAELIVLAGVPPMARFPSLPQPLRAFLGRRAALLDQSAAELARSLPGVRHVPTPLPAADHFAADRFHPGELGYQLWADHLVQTLTTPGHLL